MRKIFESLITAIVALLSLVLCVRWYQNTKEIEPMVGIIAALGTLLMALVYRFFPEKKETVPDVAPSVSIETKEAVLEHTTLQAGQNAVVGNHNTIQQTYINYADGKKIPRLLTNPPFNSEYFIGREKDLQAIEDEYRQRNRPLVLVNGEGGIGKTTLAAKYWYAHEARYQHLAWLFVDGGIGPALAGLAPNLGIRFGPEDDEKAQITKITEALNNLEKPILLVLDNANNAQDLDAHYIALGRLSGCHVLLTSRTRREDMPTHAVQPLELDDVVRLFRHHYPRLDEAEQPLLHDILHAVGLNTLVAELLAKNLALSNKYAIQYGLPDLLADLQAKGLLALKNKAVKVVYGSEALRTATPAAIIAAMYDLAQLDEPERHLLSNLAVLPAENIAYTLLRTLLGAEGDTLDTPLRGLEEKGWLEYRDADQSFKISPVVQEVTKSKNADWLLADCRTLVNTLITGLDEDHRHTDNYQAATVWARLGEVLVQAMPLPDVDVSILCQNIGEYHNDTGGIPQMMAAYQKMVVILTALHEAEPENADFKNGLAISYSKLGNTHTVMGNLEQALTFFEDYNRLSEELYAAYPSNVSFKKDLAISYGKLGETHTALGNLQQALAFFEDCSRLFEELYAADPSNVSFKNGLATSYSKLGETHTALGNLKQALTFFEERSRLGEELYAAYPSNVSFKNGLAVSYAKLGSTHTALGNLQQALTFFQDYNRLMEELYAAYPSNVSFKNGLAISYEKLGETHTALGNLEQALTFFQDYTRLSEALYAAYPSNVSFKNGLAISYSKLGDTHTKMGNLEQALTFFEKDIELSQELYTAYPANVSFKNGLAISYSKLGDTHTALGNLEQALTFFQDYNRLREALYAAYPSNVSFKNGLATSYLLLGRFHRDQNHDAETAQHYFQKGYDLYVELVRDFPQYPSFQQNYNWVKMALDK